MRSNEYEAKPSPWLTKLLEEVGFRADAKRDQRRMSLLGSKLHDYPVFRKEVESYCDQVLYAMGKLETPGRRVVTEDEVKALRRNIIPVWVSFRAAKELLRIASLVPQIRKPFGDLMLYYFQDREEFRQYEVLRKWLWRRTVKGQEYSKEYNGKPERKRRIAENRPSKEAERERKRLAYWAKKGEPMPPKRGYVPVVEFGADEPSELDESDIASIFQDSTQETSVPPHPLH